jgi:hypothetical protein
MAVDCAELTVSARPRTIRALQMVAEIREREGEGRGGIARRAGREERPRAVPAKE